MSVIYPDDRRVMTPELFKAHQLKRECDGNNINSRRLRNIGSIWRLFLCGLVEWFTCCCGCCGCGGKCRPHTGTVKYDDPEFNQMRPADQRRVVVIEHVDALGMASPRSCLTCCMCMGCCGMLGPKTTVACVQLCESSGI